MQDATVLLLEARMEYLTSQLRKEYTGKGRRHNEIADTLYQSYLDELEQLARIISVLTRRF